MTDNKAFIMCVRTIHANVCPNDCDRCAWGIMRKEELMSEIEVMVGCKFEDLDNDNCVNCFNGFPVLECPKQEAEREQRLSLIHKKEEAIKRKEYDRGYREGKAEAILQQCNHDQAVKDAYEQGRADENAKVLTQFLFELGKNVAYEKEKVFGTDVIRIDALMRIAQEVEEHMKRAISKDIEYDINFYQTRKLNGRTFKGAEQ